MAIVRAAGGARPRTAACAGSATRIAFDGSLGETIAAVRSCVSRSRSVCEQRSALQIHPPRRDDGVRVAHLVLLVPCGAKSGLRAQLDSQLREGARLYRAGAEVTRRRGAETPRRRARKMNYLIP